jgi:prolyl-tRNA synthetase
MMDSYSFDATQEGLDASYRDMLQAYKNIYSRCGLDYLVVEADSGAIGGKDSHEFMLPAESGEDEIVTCKACGYAANVEKARFNKGAARQDASLPLKNVATPGMHSIEEVAGFLKVPAKETLKAVFYVADGRFIFVVIRGDLPVNEIKLANALHASDLRLATDAEAKEQGIIPGCASPIGLKGVKIIADDSIESGTNFVAGGNLPETHVRNVNVPRDFKPDMVLDIARAQAGNSCPMCGGVMTSVRGIEVGHIFKLGTFYSQALGANFTDEAGAVHPIIMGCYGIGIGRMLGAAIEQHNDDKGIIWPVPIAPYHVYLCPLYREGTKVDETAEKLYTDLQAAGIEVLFDDRKESPGVKFNDADLFGIPVRVTVSARTLEKGAAEVKQRAQKESSIVPLSDLLPTLKQLLSK